MRHQGICLWALGLFTIVNAVKNGLYSLKAMDIKGDQVSFDSFKGQVLLIVNVASECGYTDGHYTELQRLQDILGRDDLFQVLAFPCNQFGGQEPASDHDILSFATKQYKVDFPMFSKVDVKGREAHPVWKFLIKESGDEPRWNFYKYLIDHKGKVVDVFPPTNSVGSIFSAVERLVDKARASKSNKKSKKKELRDDGEL